MAAHSPPRPPSRGEGAESRSPRKPSHSAAPRSAAPREAGPRHEDRLQKIIAGAGISSRRAAEELILAGRVRVNGRIVTELGAKADPREDKIEVDGKRLVAEDLVYYVLHKPKNVVSTLSDPEGRPTVGEMLGRLGGRVYPVGRLDFPTSGVILATNDGAFANGLLHPRRAVPKTYVVKVQGLMSAEDLDRWREGVELDDGPTLPATARLIRHEEDKTWFEVTITEGRNHQIRRMGDATGFRVMRLARTSFAGITHDGLKPGQLRPLTSEELLALREKYGVPKKVRRTAAAVLPSPARGGGPGQRRERTFKRGDSSAARSDSSAARGASARDDVRSARTDRSGTKPRGAGSRGPRARGPAGRSGSRERS